MNRLIGVVLLVTGVMLVIFGINASESFASDISRFFTGAPTEKSIWMFIAGLVSSALGLFYTLRVAHSG